ncbi:MAG: acyl carrier protein [bacterium]|nr:acyl carrier protein [bacterium]
MKSLRREIIEEEVKEILSTEFNIDYNEISLDSNLALDFGLTSVDLAELAFYLEVKEPTIEIPDERLCELEIVKDVVDLVDNLVCDDFEIDCEEDEEEEMGK